jgi:O-antigen/teichoic acid export membrane protein
MAYTVAQNTSFLTVASVLQKIISFGYFILVARLIGVENTGQYFFAISFTTIFTVVADFGFAPVLTRETAKYPERSQDYLTTVFSIKFCFGILTFGLVFLATRLLGYGPALSALIFLSAVTMFFDNLQTSFFSIFRARKNLRYESVVVVLSQFTTMIIGTVSLLNHAPLIWLIGAYTIPSALFVLVSIFVVRRVYQLKLRFHFVPEIARGFARIAWPFALAGILGRLYSYSDSILMSKLLSPTELGYWSVPYKITFAFQFIPVALSASVYPAMSSLTVAEPQKIGQLFTKAWRYLFTLVFPLAFGLMAIAQPVIIKIYGQAYAPAVPVLRILLGSLIFSFLAFITGALLNATNNQSKQTAVIAMVLIINLALNFYAIPHWGILGAAWSAFISNIILATLGLYFSQRYIPIDKKILIKSCLQTLWPAALMAVGIYFLTLRINFFYTIPLGVLCYGGILWFTKVIDRELVTALFAKLSSKATL